MRLEVTLETVLSIGLGAAGGVGTYALALFSESWRTRLGMKAAKDDRDALRASVRQDRREDFEIATLTELQDVIQTMARQAGLGHYFDEMHFKATGRWITGAPSLPEEAGGEASLIAGRTFLRLKPRVPSADLRTTLDAFHDSCNAVATAAPGDGKNDRAMRDQALMRMGRMVEQLEAAQEALGSRLRDLYAS